MVASQNGWIANEPDRVARQTVPGTAVGVTVRKDAPGLLLLEVASAFDRLVEDIDNARGHLDDWGYAERPIRGSSTTSNHASGTAVDLNSTRRPLGVPAIETMSSEQIMRCHEIEDATGGVVRWGGDWSRPDAMHWEIAPGQSMADCERALAAMRAFNASPATDPVSDPVSDPITDAAASRRVLRLRVPRQFGPDVEALQRGLNAVFPSYSQLEVDGRYGPATAAVVTEFQRRAGLEADGVAGRLTWEALAGFGI